MNNNRNDGHNPKLRALIQPDKGMDSDVCYSVVEILNQTLANEAVLTQKTRSAHWNVSGAGFYDRYTLFDAQYEQLNDISEEISKRTRVLGGLPIGSFQEFLKNTLLVEKSGDFPSILDLIADHAAVIQFLRKDAKKCLEKYEDKVTRDFLVNIQRLHKKMVWMLRSCISLETTRIETSVT